MILGTNAISALLDGDERLGRLLSNTSKHHLPVNVVAEYLFGLRSAKKGSRLQTVFRKLEADSEMLFPNRQTADWYASIRHDLKLRGKPIPEGDLSLAKTSTLIS